MISDLFPNKPKAPAFHGGGFSIGKQRPVLSDCEAGESKGHLPPGGCHPLSGKHNVLLLIVYADFPVLQLVNV